MFQKIIMIVIIAFAMGIVGCRACSAPYDLCQPTFIPEEGDCCMGELYRSGSVLGGVQHKRNASSDCQSCSGEITPESAYYLQNQNSDALNVVAYSQNNNPITNSISSTSPVSATGYSYQTTAPLPNYNSQYNNGIFNNSQNLLNSNEFVIPE